MERAVASLDQAINIAAENIPQHRNQALKNAAATWYETWFPRIAEANGRRHLDKADDVKDHQPVRTIDMSYLVYRELLYPLSDWANQESQQETSTRVRTSFLYAITVSIGRRRPPQ